MPHATYCSSWIRHENWDASSWGEEAMSPMKCLILQVYFLLPKPCLTSSYEPGMTCHWVTSHFSCTGSSAAPGPSSSRAQHFARAASCSPHSDTELPGERWARRAHSCTRLQSPAWRWPGDPHGTRAGRRLPGSPQQLVWDPRGTKVKALVPDHSEQSESRCRQRLWRAEACFEQYAVSRSQICTEIRDY